MSMLEAKVEGLALDMTTNSPVVILAPLSVNKVLPIWIGHAEAWGIAIQLTGIQAQRPMTYDLLKEIIDATQATITKVEITELKEQTFYAKVYLQSVDDRLIEIDARPSDSIALALKMKAPIFVSDSLLHVSEEQSQKENSMPTDPDSLRERLKKINPEDFGNYSL
ncbi:MAG TPA: bifunctional nuclease family protein [candidate division Zixibacteria bacterium]|nr:bifunctional nuclease family protein [candidate division Zixibacteria bacterium]